MVSMNIDDPQPLAERPEPQRDETDDDLDLLTYNEARVRLAEEIVAEERRRDALRQRLERGDSLTTRDELVRCGQRLRALQDAAARTRNPVITAANAAQFYGLATEPPQE